MATNSGATLQNEAKFAKACAGVNAFGERSYGDISALRMRENEANIAIAYLYVTLLIKNPHVSLRAYIYTQSARVRTGPARGCCSFRVL